MSRVWTYIVIVVAVCCFPFGVFFIEDGLFNPGNVDIKEFNIGVVFLITGLLGFAGSLSCRRLFPASVAMFLSVVLISGILVYINYSYSRWLDRALFFSVEGATKKVMGLVKASEEWIMIDEALLQRPARWYESGVTTVYLDDRQLQSQTIELPLKYLPLRTLKDPSEVVLPPADL